MKSGYYNRSAYRALGLQPPSCFIELDVYFDQHLSKPELAFISKKRVWAENLCRRMGDVELFSRTIANLQSEADIYRVSILTSSMLVAFYSACQSTVDAASITIAELYNLQLRQEERDFTRAKFKKLLKKNNPEVLKRYICFENLATEIKKWRNAAIHRKTPLVLPSGAGDPFKLPREQIEFKLWDGPDDEIWDVLTCIKKKDIKFIDTLYHYNRWKENLISLCSEVCKDIQDVDVDNEFPIEVRVEKVND